MELRNDPRMYSGGAVAFDSSPSVNVYAQLMAKKQAEKQAKEEAATQYFHNILKDLNPAGIRQVHLGGVQGQPPGIIDKINAWKERAIANKSEIAKGGRAKMESDMEVGAIMQDIQKAKNRDKFLLELGKSKFEGTYDPDEDDFHVIDRVSGSIYDPKTYKDDGVSEFGWGDLPSKAAEFDVDKQNKFWGTVDRGIEAGKVYDYSKKYRDTETGEVIVPFREIHTPEQIKEKAERARQLARTDPSAKRYYKKLIEIDNDQLYKKYNAPFKAVYGQDIQSAEDYAAAEAILRYAIPAKEGQEQQSNYEQKQNDKRINITLNQGGSGGNNSSIRDVFAEIYGLVSGKAGGNLPLNELTTTAQSVVLKQARDLMGDDELSQDRVYITKKPDGKIVIRKTAKSRVISPNDPVIGEMDFEGTNIGVQPSVKEKREVIQQGNKTKQQPKPTKDPLKLF